MELEGFPVFCDVDCFWKLSVNRDMDGDLDQFDDTDDELLSSLPLSFPFEDPSAGLENKPRPKEEDKNGEDKDVILPDKFAFPFEPYDIQVAFMRRLYLALEGGKIGIFESPTGTGKSLSLICGALTWLRDYEERQKSLLQSLLNDVTDAKAERVNEETEASRKDAELDWITAFARKQEIDEKASKLKEEQEARLKRESRLQQLRKTIRPRGKRKKEPLEAAFDDLFKDAPDDMKQQLANDRDDNGDTDGNTDIDSDIVLTEYVSEDEVTEGDTSEDDDDTEDHITKIYYCSRTHSQLSQFVREIQKSPFGGDTKVVSLGSRQNLCINEAVKRLKSLNLINDRCLELQRNKTVTKKTGDCETKKRKALTGGCPFFKQDPIFNYRDRILVEVKDIEQLVTVGRQTKACPYYGTRKAIPAAQVVALPYNTLLHRETRESCGIKLKGNIVIIDEAHNLLDTISSIHSIEVTASQARYITCASSQLNQYQERYLKRLKAKNLMYIRQILFILTSFNKYLTGNSFNKYFTGNSFNRYLTGNTFNKYFTGNSFNKYLTGNSFNKYFTGNSFNKYLTGNTFNKYFTGNSFNRYLTGNSFNKYLTGNSFNKHLTGNTFNKYFTGNSFNRYLTGNSFNKYFTGNSFNRYLTCNTFNKYFTGNSFNRCLTGNTFDKYLPGNSFNRYITGNSFNKYLTDNTFNKYFTGNSFNKYLTGNSFNKYLPGNSFKKYLTGNNFNKYLPGNSFNKYLTGNKFNKYLTGNSFNKYLTGNNFNKYLTGNSFYKYLTGNNFNKYLTGNSFNKYLTGKSFNKYLTGNSFKKYLTGNNFNKYLPGNSFNKYLTGNNFNKYLTGNSFNKYLTGNNFNKYLTGNSFYKYLTGNSFNKYLTGNSFNKYLTGHTGTKTAPPRKNKSETVIRTINDFLFDTKLDNLNLFKLKRYCRKSQISKKLHGFVEKYQPSLVTRVEVKTKPEPPTWALSKFLKEISQSKENVTSGTAETTDSGQPKPTSQVSLTSPLMHIESLLEALTSANKDGRIIINRQDIATKSSLKFLLLNPAVHFADVVSEARAIIVAGGTMQPLTEFKEQLFYAAGVPPERILEFACGHVIPSEQLLPVAMARGPSGHELDFTYQSRDTPQMMHELGRVMYNLCNIVPGGIVIFFPSYEYERRVYTHWETNGFLDKMAARKKIFREPRHASQVDHMLNEYTAYIKRHLSSKSSSFTGAVLLCVVGGKMSEGINFSDELGRCIVMVGLPYPNIRSPELKEKMDYLNANMPKCEGKLPGQVHYENLCMKAVNQSIGRAIRHKGDYATILLLDHRYLRPSIREKLPSWISESLSVMDRFGPAFAAIRKFFAERERALEHKGSI
ncbi:hypothetical protein NP493_610g02000 [Ridgeia piscesae]|uniref:Helicase ATP-binding domain-containing protein n=1 Tax=Ridgeia piscesae TaxID=27915 RepID=A0AAD9KT98_RIDPI|nr:hypothetical protein NP493_610g02000 [Ridgeia piscesae]